MRALMIRYPAGPALARCNDFLQRRDKRWPIARDVQPLDAGGGPSHEAYVAPWDAHDLGDHVAQRNIGLTITRRRLHPYFENSPSIRHDLNAVDCIAAALRREANDEIHATGNKRPGYGRHRSEYIRIDVPDDDVLEEQDDQDQDHRRDVDPAKIGQQRAY